MKQSTGQFVTETFKKLEASSYMGIFGVIKIDNGIAGPTVCISVCTHGNEPSGLYGAGTLLHYFEKRQTQITGTLFIVLNNLQATAQYIAALNAGVSGNFRYVDVNMNRLPFDVFTKQTACYEELRAQELQPIWQQIEYALDVHSTTLPSDPFIVNPKPELAKEIISGLPIYKIISNTDSFASGFPAVHFYGTNKNTAQAIGIECGSHEDEKAFSVAAESMFSFLHHTKTIYTAKQLSSEYYALYQIQQSLYRPDTSYRLTKEFANFEFVPAGTILMQGEGSDIELASDSHSFFVSSLTETPLTEEVMFLSAPVERIKL